MKWILSILICFLPLCLASIEASAPPNVLVILTDDQGWGDLSLHGNKSLSTPNVDRLARSGASFERFYVQPVCAPTRAEFLTGRYAPRLGTTGVSRGNERMDASAPTIIDAFRQAGYATAAFGKWHNGTQAPYHPLCRGFDEFYGFTSGHWGLYFDPPLDHNGRLIKGNGYLTDDLTAQTIQFIESHRAQPFFAYVAYNTPHSPMQVPGEWWDRFADKPIAQRGTRSDREDINHTRAAMAMCENIDWNVGRLLAALEENSQLENTIVVYFTDNGPNGHRWNGGMRGIKGSTDEGGVRVPLFISWPAAIPTDRNVQEPAAAIDLAPTLASLSGLEWEQKALIDGSDLRPLLMNEPRDWPERTLFTHWYGKTAARRGSFVLDAEQRLYDLSTGPGQTNNIAAEHPEIAQSLVDAVRDWRSEVLLSENSPRPFVVGHTDLKTTFLPARDAESHGGIKRSSRHPNCSYFTNWKSLDDHITWPVEVATAGKYLVELYYTCSEQNVGGVIELGFNGKTAQAKVTPQHDPPLLSIQHNRVPASESAVKEFRPLELGEIELSQTSGQLTLRALEIPGDELMDCSLLVLSRVDD